MALKARISVFESVSTKVRRPTVPFLIAISITREARLNTSTSVKSFLALPVSSTASFKSPCSIVQRSRMQALSR